MLTKEKRKGLIKLLVFALVMILACALLAKPVISMVRDPAAFRAWVDENRTFGRLAMIALMMVQVVFAFLPGEPIEIAAGVAFGTWEGMALCLIGATLGCLITANMTRRHGRSVMEAFFPADQIQKLPFFGKPQRQMMMMVFLLYLIPGTPKDLFNYALGLTRLPIARTVAMTALARVPSVITSTISGDALGMQNAPLAVIALVATGVVSLLGVLAYRRMCRQ